MRALLGVLVFLPFVGIDVYPVNCRSVAKTALYAIYLQPVISSIRWATEITKVIALLLLWNVCKWSGRASWLDAGYLPYRQVLGDIIE